MLTDCVLTLGVLLPLPLIPHVDSTLDSDIILFCSHTLGTWYYQDVAAT